MHITKYRGRTRESEKPAVAATRIDPTDVIVAKVVERLQPILTQPAPPPAASSEEILRGMQELLVHLAHRVEESTAKLLDDRAMSVKKALQEAAPAKSGAPDTGVIAFTVTRDVSQELAKQNEQLVQKFGSVLGRELAALSAQVSETVARLIPPDPNVVAGLVAQEVQTSVDASSDKVRQAIASLTQAMLEKIQAAPIATAASAAPAAPAPAADLGPIREEISKAGKELRKDVWSIEQKVEALVNAELEKKLTWIVPGLVVDAVRDGVKAGMKPEEIAPALVKPLREMAAEDRKAIRKDVWSIEKKVEELVNAELEKKLTWIVPGLVVDAVRDGVKAGMKPEEIVPALIKPLRDLGKQDRKLARKDVWSIEQKIERLVDTELEKKLTWIVPGLVVDAVRDGVKEATVPRPQAPGRKKKKAAKSEKKPKKGSTVDLLRKLTPRTEP